MQPLTLEETRLKEQMKERCLAKGQYIDENAKAKFNMLCHLEDFEVQYWELQQENKQLKERINKSIDYIGSNDIEVLKYHDIPSETTSYEIVTIDLLKILKGENNE